MAAFLRFEEAIAWREDPMQYNYLCEFQVLRMNRKLPITFTSGYRLIGSSILETGAQSFRTVRTSGKGMFLRRVWVLPKRRGDSLRPIPIGAVVPSSISVGKVSQPLVEVPL
jgi:hypothetical protein